MLNLTKKQPRRRPQIFNDYDHAAIEAALAKEDWLNYRSKQLIHDLADAARKTRQRLRYAGSAYRAVGWSPVLSTR